MKYLFIDTETTGLPKDKNCSPMDVDNWPRLVSLAYILCDNKEIVEKKYYLIKPNRFIIPAEATKIHGITTAEAASKGQDLSDVLNEVKPIIEKCDYIVGHNVAFDINVINAEYYRYNHIMPASLKPNICTMKLSRDYCGLPNNKYPKLQELYTLLKGEPFSDAHNALKDTQVCMECFWILKDSGIINSEKQKPIIIIYPTVDNIKWAAEHISMEYTTKAHAYLAIACNLIDNQKNFLERDSGFTNSSIQACSSISYPNSNDEWMKNMFKNLDKYLLQTISEPRFSKFDGSRIVKEKTLLKAMMERSYYLLYDKRLNSIIDNFKKPDYEKEQLKDYLMGKTRAITIEDEVGIKEIIEKYKLKNPISPNATLVLEEESSWVDIAIEAVKTRIQSAKGSVDEQQLSADAESCFVSMIEYINDIRENEWIKRSEKWHKEFEEAMNPENRKKRLEMIQNYATPSESSSSGCMLLFAIFLGTSSTFLFFCSFLVMSFFRG